MRVTIVNQFYKPDLAPTATLAASLAEDRARRGDEVTIIAGKGGYTGGAGGASKSSANPRVRRVWTPGLGKATHLKRLVDYAAFYLFAFLRLLTMPRQDVIISLTTPPLIAWAAIFHRALHPGTKLILWNMDCYPDAAERQGVMTPGGFLASRCRARNRAIYRKFDHLVCLDTAMARLLCSQYASVNPGLAVSIIPNFEDASFFPRDAGVSGKEFIAKRGLEGRFVVLYLGNMGYGHQFDTALDAADRLREEPFTFLFIGGGKRVPEIQAEIERRGLRNVVVEAYIPKGQTPAAMAASSVALVTLRDDSLGVMSPSKIHANLALSLPLLYVGPATSNVDDAIRNHGVGLSLRHGQVDEFVAFLRKLRAEPAELAVLRARARAAFEAAYCDQATMPLFDRVIEHARGGHATAPIPTATAAQFAGAHSAAN